MKDIMIKANREDVVDGYISPSGSKRTLKSCDLIRSAFAWE